MIDDQRRNLIGLAIDEAKDFGIAHGAFAEISGLAQAGAKESSIDFDIFVSNQADGNLRLVAIESASEESAALVHHAYDRTGFGIGHADIALIDPRVARSKTL